MNGCCSIPPFPNSEPSGWNERPYVPSFIQSSPFYEKIDFQIPDNVDAVTIPFLTPKFSKNFALMLHVENLIDGTVQPLKFTLSDKGETFIQLVIDQNVAGGNYWIRGAVFVLG